MPLDIIVGAQWGDEGKGRVVDLLSAQADFVARFNGGDNAGHTVTVGDQTFKLPVELLAVKAGHQALSGQLFR